MNLDINQINDILNDIWNFHLILFGIALSIFTLLYSFIQSKRDELKGIAEQVKSGNKDPLLFQKESFAKSYIRKMGVANNHLALTILITFCFFIISWTANRLVSNQKYDLKLGLLNVMCFVTLMTIITFSIIFFRTWKQYKSDIKI